ncbi:DMT family transporter [Emergencia timonensis]|uniref:DMT family transporter n=1 Tax=Emergencia timonensis TaxID=1776384 RepID=UPI003991D4DB
MKKYALFLVLLAGVSWGAIGVFVKALNNYGVDSMQIVEAKTITSICAMGLIILVRDKRMFQFKLKHSWTFIGAGMAGVILSNQLYYITIKTTSLSVAAVLLYTSPIFIMLFSAVLFQEKITKTKVLSFVMAFTGCMLVSGIFENSAVLNFQGMAIGLCSGVGYALYTIFSRYAINYGYPSLTIQFYTFVIAAVVGVFFTDFGQIKEAMEADCIPVVLAILGAGLLSTTIPSLAYTAGMRYMDNGKASIMVSIDPVVAILIGIVFFSEKPTVISALGMIISIGAVVQINRTQIEAAKQS